MVYSRSSQVRLGNVVNVMSSSPLSTGSQMGSRTQTQVQTQSPRKTTAITRLCWHASEAEANGVIPWLQLDGHRFTSIRDSAKAGINWSMPVSLKEYLKEGHQNEDLKLTPKQQTVLSRDIASSVLQLRETNWINDVISSNAIRISSERNLTTIPNTFMGHVTLHRTVPVAPFHCPKESTLELAILLLEIWNHRPLELWAQSQGLDGADTVQGRHWIVVKWLEKTAERLPGNQLTAIEKCLAIFSGRLQRWDDEEFLELYCENILLPLLDSCKAFRGV